MPLRHGFKSQAHQIAREVRRELGLDLADPINVVQLAAKLEIPLVPLTLLRVAEPEAVRHFTHVDTGAFSAVTLFKGRTRFVVYNDRHASTRRASDLAHEIAHALLQHPPHAALDNRGCRIWPADCEDEANWLGGALLVSEEAALSIARRQISRAEAASEYDVSEDMIQYRLNVTGAVKRASYARSWRGPRSK